MENLKKSFKKINWKVNGRLFGFGTNPEIDWKIIFISTIVLATAVILLSIFIFIKIDKGEIFVVKKQVEEAEETFDVAVLRNTVSYYQDNALQFERIKNTKLSAVDPSL